MMSTMPNPDSPTPPALPPQPSPTRYYPRALAAIHHKRLQGEALGVSAIWVLYAGFITRWNPYVIGAWIGIFILRDLLRIGAMVLLGHTEPGPWRVPFIGHVAPKRGDATSLPKAVGVHLAGTVPLIAGGVAAWLWLPPGEFPLTVAVAAWYLIIAGTVFLMPIIAMDGEYILDTLLHRAHPRWILMTRLVATLAAIGVMFAITGDWVVRIAFSALMLHNVGVRYRERKVMRMLWREVQVHGASLQARRPEDLPESVFSAGLDPELAYHLWLKGRFRPVGAGTTIMLTALYIAALAAGITASILCVPS